MHALHSLAHRAPPATRTRVRWQPYNSIPGSSCSSGSSPSASYLNTPTSVTSSPPAATPSVEFDRIRQTLSSTTSSHTLKDAPAPIRNKYAIGLVDQAVKSLSEIWRPQDIPPIFLTMPHAMATGTLHEIGFCPDRGITHLKNSITNTQLPSPISPSAQQHSPFRPSTFSTQPGQLAQDATRNNPVPIKGFVHEVLRRSRTSGCVLQTALCYLEAIRAKVPELIQQEKMGMGFSGKVAPDDRIIQGTDVEIALDTRLDSIMNTEKDVNEDFMDTVRIFDTDGESEQHKNTSEHTGQYQESVDTMITGGPLLPSPLLCPRRAFLASLILASKFTQDKCYSNRAWAKLSGLSPREIGRCERALGEALEWRLWVGKLPAPQASSAPAIVSTNRPVIRSQSESSLLNSPAPAPFLLQNEKSHVLATPRSPGRHVLRRCATLPVEVFTPPDRGSFCPVSGKGHQIGSPEPSFAQHTSKPSTTLAHVGHLSQSPSPDTPGLTYSPSSTESSSGDGTIQMTMLSDELMAPPNLPVASSLSWPWFETQEATKSYSRPALLSKAEIAGQTIPVYVGHLTSSPINEPGIPFTGSKLPCLNAHQRWTEEYVNSLYTE